LQDTQSQPRFGRIVTTRRIESFFCRRTRRASRCGYIAWLALGASLLASCADSSEDPLAAGLTPEQQAQLIEQSITEIERTENFDPANFEQLQRLHIESMGEEMRDAALESLPKRTGKIGILEMSQTLALEPESAEIELRTTGPGRLVALVSVKGTRSYRTSNVEKTVETRATLPWVITADHGKLVYRHRGIRMTDLTN
jgi:hypothetical protein